MHFLSLRPRKHKRVLARLPQSWHQIDLRQYLNLQVRLPGTEPLERLRWQVAICAKTSWAEILAWDTAEVCTAGQRMAFLAEAVPESESTSIRMQEKTFSFPPDLGDLPLVAWVLLEREFLNHPERLHALAAGEFQELPRLLALVARPEGEGYDMRDLPTAENALLHLPVPIALGWLRRTLEGVSAVQSQYPELFSEGAEVEARPQPTPYQAYLERWGWTALLADLNGGYLTPAARQELLSAPIHVIFQELARRQHWQTLRAA